MLLAALISSMMLASYDPAALTVQHYQDTITPFSSTTANGLDYSTTTIKAYAKTVAIQHGFNTRLFTAVLNCESGFVWDKKGDYTIGDGKFYSEKDAPPGAWPTSFGIAQFHYPPRDWGVSTSTVLNPYTAVDMMADAWEKNLQGRWTCYRLNQSV